MAKNNNLTDFLTDVADAIRAKKGTTEKINPQNFSAEIASIETGGGSVVENDLTFYDYDGTILYSYSKEEAESMTELPIGPQHSGLVFDGWSSTLTEIKERMSNHGKWGVGAFFQTEDKRIRLYLTLEREAQKNVTISLYGKDDVVGNVTWGDGMTEQFSIPAGTSLSITHIYNDVGDYIVAFGIEGGEGFCFNSNIVGQDGANPYSFIIRKVEISSKYYNESSHVPFKDCKRLETITFPNRALRTTAGMFYGCVSLKHLCFPMNYGTLDASECPNLKIAINKFVGNVYADRYLLFTNSYSLEKVYSTGEDVKPAASAFNGCRALTTFIKSSYSGDDYYYQIFENSFKNCVSLRQLYNRISLDYKNSSGGYFMGCTNLEQISIWSARGRQIGFDSFNGCGYLKCVNISEVKEIKGGAFKDCKSLEYIRFSDYTSVVGLASVNALEGISSSCKIYVPSNLVAQWKEATNWVSYANMIVPDINITECTSLSITAEDVSGNAKSVKIQITAIVNGYDVISGVYKEGVTVNDYVFMEIPKNPSTTDSIERELKVEYYGMTATTTITQTPYIDYKIVCKYNVTSTTSATQLIYSSFSDYSTYFSYMLIDGEEVPIATSYTFATTGEHEVVFKVYDDMPQITKPYMMFYNITALTEADCSTLDLSKATATSTSAGTAYMFYGCTNLNKIILPETISYMGYYMFYKCTKVTNLTVLNPTAPELYSANTFGSSSYNIGYSNKSYGKNKLYVPAGATGYDDDNWGSSYLQNKSYCGFTKVELTEN